MNKQLNWSILVVFILILVILTGCQPGGTDQIRYGGQYYPGEFVLKGSPEIWENNDVVVEHILFSSGTENNQALISGEIDVNVGSDSKTVSLFGAIPDDAVIIAAIQRGDRYSTIVRADSTYQSWEDLKGKTVGTRLGTGAEQVLLRYFDQTEGLSWDDFEWVNINI
jgi:ABC-type nitrate/sulfonate/bicarbonate transport system substrate-binding protein